MRRCLLFVVVALVAGPAFAQNAPRREGDYGGVVPGQKSDGEGKKKKRPAKGTLSWIGFEAKNGGAQLFFQSAAPFEVTQRVAGSTLIVTLSLRRLAANTWRKIDTRYFDTPLAGVQARAVRRGKDRIEVRITFKDPKAAREGSLRTATEADGMFYAYLTFDGAGSPPASDEPES